MSPDKRQDWMIDMGFNDFPTMPSTTALPGMGEGDLPDFLTLPNDDDWSRWHNGPGDISTDLDGFPPRGRYQAASNFNSPPMGGIMNG
jgi:hypothetical protein